MSIVGDAHDAPWSVLGDFNDILRPDEKSGGAAPSRSRMRKFRECVDHCNLIDLGFSGQKYTWSNKRQGLGLIQERLDRVFANPNWRSIFPNANVRHLSRTHSDHCPILLNTIGEFPLYSKPFRFEACWLDHPDLVNIVKEAWLNDQLTTRYFLNASAEFPSLVIGVGIVMSLAIFFREKEAFWLD